MRPPAVGVFLPVALSLVALAACRPRAVVALSVDASADATALEVRVSPPVSAPPATAPSPLDGGAATDLDSSVRPSAADVLARARAMCAAVSGHDESSARSFARWPVRSVETIGPRERCNMQPCSHRTRSLSRPADLARACRSWSDEVTGTREPGAPPRYFRYDTEDHVEVSGARAVLTTSVGQFGAWLTFERDAGGVWTLVAVSEKGP